MVVDALHRFRAYGYLAAEGIVEGGDQENHQAEQATHEQGHVAVHGLRAHVEEECGDDADEGAEDDHPPEGAR